MTHCEFCGATIADVDYPEKFSQTREWTDDRWDEVAKVHESNCDWVASRALNPMFL